MKEEALLKAIRFFGSRKLLAKALDIKPQVVNNWLNRGDNIPYEYAIVLESLTNKIITVEQLSPNKPMANNIINLQKQYLEEANIKINIQQSIIEILIDLNISLLEMLLSINSKKI